MYKGLVAAMNPLTQQQEINSTGNLGVRVFLLSRNKLGSLLLIVTVQFSIATTIGKYNGVIVAHKNILLFF